MKTVLLIAYFFPPISNSGTQRPLKFANYLPDFGWKPIVLTIDRPPFASIEPQLLEEVRPGTCVVRVPMLNDKIGDYIGRLCKHKLDSSRISSGISWRLRSLWRSPDTWAMWRPTAVNAAKKIFHELGFDLIWATGGPWTSLLIGRDVARYTGRPMIADFRDPWYAGDTLLGPKPNLLSRLRHQKFQRSVLKHSKGVVTVTDELTQSITRLSPRKSGPQHFLTISNGFDLSDIKAAQPFPEPATGLFRVVYTGVWKDGYSPEILYRTIAVLHQSNPADISNLEVLTAGYPPSAARRFGISRYVRELGLLPHAAALGLMQSANMLFLVDGPHERIALPGKVFEYLASNKPVLALASRDRELARLIDKIGGGLVIDPNDRNLLSQILLRGCRERRITVPPIQQSSLDQYERRRLASKLSLLLDEIQCANQGSNG